MGTGQECLWWRSASGRPFSQVPEAAPEAVAQRFPGSSGGVGRSVERVSYSRPWEALSLEAAREAGAPVGRGTATRLACALPHSFPACRPPAARTHEPEVSESGLQTSLPIRP